jgi:hypothetical protein
VRPRPFPTFVPTLASLLTLVLAVAPAAAEVVVRAAPPGARAKAARPKVEVPTSALLLPFYLVDTTSGSGATTLFAVRNEGEAPVDVQIHYFRVDRPDEAVATQLVELAAKQIRTFNVRDRVGPLHLPVDGDGFARGYVTIEAETGATIQGDQFFVDTAEAFAQGDRLVDMGAASAQSGLCQRIESRYLNGAGFSGTLFRFWLAADAQPSTAEPVAFYTVYDEAGVERLGGTISADTVAFEVDVDTLTQVGPVSGPAFGAIEVEFNGTVGHLAAVMNADGLYSVGFAGACLDDQAP